MDSGKSISIQSFELNMLFQHGFLLFWNIELPAAGLVQFVF